MTEPAQFSEPDHRTEPAQATEYKVLTGPDDAAFCARVTEALANGYRLYGSPAVTYNGENVIVAQAIVR